MNILRSRNHHVARYHSLLVNIARIAGACIGNSGLKKERCARERHACLPLARPFFLRPNTFARLLHWLCSIRTIQQRRRCRQQSSAIDINRAPGWPAMNFWRTFRDTVLKEIGKIYAMRGKKLVLSFPAPYTSVLFCVLFPVSRGFSRLPQRKNLLTGYIHTS